MTSMELNTSNNEVANYKPSVDFPISFIAQYELSSSYSPIINP